MISKSTLVPGSFFVSLLVLLFVYKPALDYRIWTIFFILLNWFLVALYIAYQRGAHPESEAAKKPLTQFGQYFIASVGFNLLIVGACAVFGLRLNLTKLAPGLLAYSFLYSLTAALFEELVFRGLLLGALLRVLPARGRIPIAIILQALPFILSHNTAWRFGAILVSLVCFAILSGIFAVYTRALWLSIAFHCAWNFSDMVVYGLNYKRLPHYAGIGEFSGNHAFYGATALVLLLVATLALIRSGQADRLGLWSRPACSAGVGPVRNHHEETTCT